MTTADAAPGKTRHIPELDGLRGLLAWWVLLGHILLDCGYSADSAPRGVRLILRGDYAVDVFIMLSGFVIFKLLNDRHERYPPFIIRRFFRLYPVFVVCLALAIALRPLLWKDIHLLQPYNEAFAALSLKNWANEAAHFWGHIAAHLTLLHGAVSNRVLPGTAFAFVAPAWSISLEWQFYLVAPVILWFFGKTGTAGWLLFVAAVVGVNFIFAHAMEDRFPIGAFLPQKLIFFWVGMLSFYLWRALSERSDGISEMLLAGIAPLVLLFTLSLPLTIWTCVMCASVSHGMQGIHGAVLRTLRSPILQRLGAMSYSTYLVHMPCLCLLEWILLPHLTGIRQWQLAAVLVPLCSAGVYFASAAMHRLIEAPGMDLGRRLALKAASRTRAKAS